MNEFRQTMFSLSLLKKMEKPFISTQLRDSECDHISTFHECAMSSSLIAAKFPVETKPKTTTANDVDTEHKSVQKNRREKKTSKKKPISIKREKNFVLRMKMCRNLNNFSR